MTKPIVYIVLSYVFLNFVLFLPDYLLLNIEDHALLPFFPDHHPYGRFSFDLVSLKQYLLHVFVRRYNLDPFRFSFEMFIIFTAGFLSAKFMKSKIIPNLGLGLIFVFFSFELYEALYYRYTGLLPSLSESIHQLYQATIYLTSLRDIPMLIQSLIGLIGILIIYRLIFEIWKFALRQSRFISASKTGFFFIFVTLGTWHISSLLWFDQSRVDPIILSNTRFIANNLQRDLGTKSNISTHFLNEIKTNSKVLRNTPIQSKLDIFFIIIESYGDILYTAPKYSKRYDLFLKQQQQILDDYNLVAFSQLSKSPTFGGMSWLASATLLTGNYVKTSAHHSFLEHHKKQVYSIIDLLNDSGYATISVEPGSHYQAEEEKSFLRFEETFIRGDLNYQGEPYGWGLVPDQYTLGYISDIVIPKQKERFFVQIKLVSTHSPFEVPKIQDHWQKLNRAKAYKNSPDILERYYQSIEYTMKSVVDFISQQRDDSLYILVGDHQPHLIKTTAGFKNLLTYNSPIHIIANEKYLNTKKSFLENYGFTQGLAVDTNKQPTDHRQFSNIITKILGKQSIADQKIGMDANLRWEN